MWKRAVKTWARGDPGRGSADAESGSGAGPRPSQEAHILHGGASGAGGVRGGLRDQRFGCGRREWGRRQNWTGLCRPL